MSENLARHLHFVPVDAVVVARVDADDHLGAECAHDRLRFAHTLNRDMRVTITAPKENRHAVGRLASHRGQNDRVADQAAT